MLKYGITINDVVREFSSTIDLNYNIYKEKADEFELVTYKAQGSLDTDELTLLKDDASFDNPSSPMVVDEMDDLMGVSKKYDFYSKTDYEDFLWEDYAFSIFGKTGLVYDKAMEDLNNLYKSIVKKGNSATIVSHEKSISKPATLLFLSYNKCMANNYKFLGNYTYIYELYDCVITANPIVYKLSLMYDKECMLIESQMNAHIKAPKYKNIYEVIQKIENE